MNGRNLAEFFDECLREDPYLFPGVPRTYDVTEPTTRWDLRAFLLLDRLVPGTACMIAAAEHDKVWLEVDPDAVNAIATDDELRMLVSCGVLYDDDVESFFMFA